MQANVKLTAKALRSAAAGNNIIRAPEKLPFPLLRYDKG